MSEARTKGTEAPEFSEVARYCRRYHAFAPSQQCHTTIECFVPRNELQVVQSGVGLAFQAKLDIDCGRMQTSKFLVLHWCSTSMCGGGLVNKSADTGFLFFQRWYESRRRPFEALKAHSRIDWYFEIVWD